jgi:hypothetical protein
MLQTKGGAISTMTKPDSEKSPCSSATSSTTNPTRFRPRSNPGFRGERSATNRRVLNTEVDTSDKLYHQYSTVLKVVAYLIATTRVCVCVCVCACACACVCVCVCVYSIKAILVISKMCHNLHYISRVTCCAKQSSNRCKTSNFRDP